MNSGMVRSSARRLLSPRQRHARQHYPQAALQCEPLRLRSGWPLRKDKLFFFTAYEGVRIALPIVTQAVVPTPAYQQYVLNQLPVGGVDPSLESISLRSLPRYPSIIDLCPLHQHCGNRHPCRLLPHCERPRLRQPARESLQNSDTKLCPSSKSITPSNSQHRLVPLSVGHSLQAAYTDPINSIFNSYSPQPQYTLVSGYTHIFRPNLVNQFNPGMSWYSSIFEPTTTHRSSVLSDGARRRQHEAPLPRSAAMTHPSPGPRR